MYWLILMFIIIPAIEIGIFIVTGNYIGVWSVILLIILTGIVGVSLVRYQGLETWKSVQLSLHHGEMPREQILDGLCVIFAGALLITPGFLTDIIGFLLVIPWTRKPFKALIKSFLSKRMSQGTIIYRKW